MARVILWKKDADKGNVPPICVRCGAPATVYKSYPVFVGLGGLPFLVIPIFQSYSIVVDADQVWLRLPFCHRHRHYMLRRRLVAYCSFIASFSVAVIFGCGGISNNPALWDRPTGPGRLFLSLELILTLSPFIWFVWFLFYRRTGVRFVRHTPEFVYIMGVCKEFADAVAASQQSRH